MYGFRDMVTNDSVAVNVESAFSAIIENTRGYVNSKSVEFKPDKYMYFDPSSNGIHDNDYYSLLNAYCLKFLSGESSGNDKCGDIKPLKNLHDFARLYSNSFNSQDVASEILSYKATTLTESLIIVSYLGAYSKKGVTLIKSYGGDDVASYDGSCILSEIFGYRFGSQFTNQQIGRLKNAFLSNALSNHRNRDPLSNLFLSFPLLYDNDVSIDSQLSLLKIFLSNLNSAKEIKFLERYISFFTNLANLIGNAHDATGVSSAFTRIEKEGTKENKIAKLISPWIFFE